MQASRLTAIAGMREVARRPRGSAIAKRGVLTTPSFARQSAEPESGRYAPGMSEASSSTTIFCADARGLSVLTSMPGAGARQHDGASTRSPPDLHHARAAVAVRAHAGLVAEARGSRRLRGRRPR